MQDLEINEEKLEAFAGKVMTDIAGAMGVLMAFIGDRAGTYQALRAHGPITAVDLAKEIGHQPLYLREWLHANAAHGYVDYNPSNETFSMSPEQALIMSEEGHPACMQGFLQAIVSQMETHDKAYETFVSGDGRPWGDHSTCLFCGTDRFFRPGYEANLLENWIPALDGIKDRLEDGGRIADIACGHGSSTVLMAKAFPKATIYGIDFHGPSIEQAREKAKAAGVENVEFQVAKAQDFEGEDFDLACIFDALHDMGDPVGAVTHIQETLKPDGSFMLVEPLAGDSLSENLHPLGAIYYSFSTVVCTPCSLSQPGAMGLGTQAGEKKLTEVLKAGGFNHVSRVAETPANMVLEARC